MVFYLLISIVFIAELIIASAVVLLLYKGSKLFRETDAFLSEAKPKIKEIAALCKEISEQYVNLASIFADKIKSTFMDMVMGQLKSIIAGVTFWAVKTEVEKHISK